MRKRARKTSKKRKGEATRVGYAKSGSASQAAKEALSIPFVREISRTDRTLSERLVRAYVLGTNTASN